MSVGIGVRFRVSRSSVWGILDYDRFEGKKGSKARGQSVRTEARIF
jgi:hypothetical protein